MQEYNKELNSLAAQFVHRWYERIDSKAPFEEVQALTIGEKLIVDFPGNYLDLDGFKSWYENQCRSYTGCHHIHSVQVTQLPDAVEIKSEITWQAVCSDGEPIEMLPDVTLRLSPESWKVYYYACTDRNT